MIKKNFPIKKIEKNLDKWVSSIKETDTITLYQETLYLQMEITKSEVIKYLFNNKDWRKAQNILDLGCGPGFLIKILSDFFPKKNYTGIDIHPDFIAYAKKSFIANNISFSESNVYQMNIDTHYDYIHVRALLQHLSDIPGFITTLSDITKPGSSVLFFDSAGSDSVNSNFIPDIPMYKQFFLKLAKQQKKKGGDRDCLLTLEKIIHHFPFEIRSSEDSFVANTNDNMRDIYFYYIYFVCELLDRMYKVRSDKKAFLSEILHWYNAESRYAQFHGKWVHLIRI